MSSQYHKFLTLVEDFFNDKALTDYDHLTQTML